jgi:hypothetical protein
MTIKLLNDRTTFLFRKKTVGDIIRYYGVAFRDDDRDPDSLLLAFYFDKKGGEWAGHTAVLPVTCNQQEGKEYFNRFAETLEDAEKTSGLPEDNSEELYIPEELLLNALGVK